MDYWLFCCFDWLYNYNINKQFSISVLQRQFMIPWLFFWTDELLAHICLAFFLFSLQAVLEKPAAVGTSTATKVEKKTVAAVCWFLNYYDLTL